MRSDAKETISFRLPSDERLALDALASSTDRNRSDLISDAIRIYIDVQRWQIEEIERSVKEADAGDFASEDEVRKVFTKLTR